MGWTYLREWSLGWTQSPGSLERASELAKPLPFGGLLSAGGTAREVIG